MWCSSKSLPHATRPVKSSATRTNFVGLSLKAPELAPDLHVCVSHSKVLQTLTLAAVLDLDAVLALQPVETSFYIAL